MDINNIWSEWHAEELLGQGAYGKVYRMSKSEFGHTSYAAAKLIEIPQDASEIANLASMGMDNLSIRSYFEGTARSIVNEIAVMESLKGAGNVVGIEDYRLVEHEDGVGWTICIRMELLQSLVDYQRKVGVPDTREAVKIGIDICNALIRCEELGVMHRDVKPENVFRDKFGDYKLGDFGISRQIEMGTRSAAVLSQKGTGPYMAPEVALGQKYGANVDVYSLGIMLYRFLNGMRFPFLPAAPTPFTAADVERAQMQRLSGEQLPPPANAPEGLAEIICKACADDPKQRYKSAREFQKDLTAWSFKEQFTRDGMGSGVTPVTVQPVERQAQPAVVTPSPSQGFQGGSRQGFGTGAAPDGVANGLQQQPPSVVAGPPSGAQPYVAPPPAKPPIVDPPVSGGGNGQGGGQGNGDGDRSKTKLIVAAACALVVVVLAVVAMTQFSDCSSGKDSGSSSSASASESSDSDYSEEGNASADEDDGQSVTTLFETSEYDLNDQDDYKLINMFLSNFSEVYGPTASIDTSSMSAEDYAMFGVYHCGINSYSDWQFAGGSGAYSDIQGTGGGAQGVYNVRIDGSRVAEMVNRYFGVSIDYSSISGGYRGPYHYQDGYVYFGVTAPVSPAGVAVAKSITYLGNDEYEIKFDVYTPSGGYYDASDTSLYSASATEIAKKMGVSSPAATGTAIVRKAGNNEHTGGLVLESYQSASLGNNNTVTIALVGADGTTRTGTIRRSGSSERVFPDSNTRRLTESEVEALSDAERCIAWNEIIAASNGYAFKNSGLAAYFNDCSWYHRNPSASEHGDLSSEATANVGLLQSKTDDWWMNLATT